MHVRDPGTPRVTVGVGGKRGGRSHRESSWCQSRMKLRAPKSKGRKASCEFGRGWEVEADWNKT